MRRASVMPFSTLMPMSAVVRTSLRPCSPPRALASSSAISKPTRMALACAAKPPPYMSISPISTLLSCADDEPAIRANGRATPIVMRFMRTIPNPPCCNIVGFPSLLPSRPEGNGGDRFDLQEGRLFVEPDLHGRAREGNSVQHLAPHLVHGGVIGSRPDEHRDLDQVLERAARRLDDVADILQALARL